MRCTVDNFSFLDNTISHELVVGKNEGVTHTNFSIVNSSSYVTEQLMLKTDFWRNRAKYQVICVMVLHKLINIIYIYIIIVKTYAYGGKSIREWQLSWHKCFTLSLEPQHILIKRIHYVHKFKLINFERLDYMYIKYLTAKLTHTEMKEFSSEKVLNTVSLVIVSVRPKFASNLCSWIFQDVWDNK